MIPPADITNVTSPLAAETTPITPPLGSAAVATALTQNSQNILTQMAVGRLLQAQVLTQLHDGSYIVGVEDSAMRMALPEGTTVGSKLQMTLLTDNPRPTFLLESQSDANSASLSGAGKIISNVLQTAQQANAPNTLVGKTPILPQPAADPPHIAAAMQDSVEFSGLFYESHVGQWVNGDRPIADLAREPQMQNKADSSTAQAGNARAQSAPSGTMLQRAGTSATELAKLIDNVRSTTDTHSSIGQAINNLLNNTRGLPQEADTIVKPNQVSAENAQTIHLQLNSLEQNRYVWQGELWPGQKMEWEIQEEGNKNKQQNQAGDDQSTWNSSVHFQLPGLGKISATIHLAGGRVQMRVATDSDATAAKLKAHGKELANAMDDAGSPLDSLLISRDEQT